jgi:hypothetical protein
VRHAARVGCRDLTIEHDLTAEPGQIGEDWAKETGRRARKGL